MDSLGAEASYEKEDDNVWRLHLRGSTIPRQLLLCPAFNWKGNYNMARTSTIEAKVLTMSVKTLLERKRHATNLHGFSWVRRELVPDVGLDCMRWKSLEVRSL